MFQNPFNPQSANQSGITAVPATEEKLIIHHLSDLHRARSAGGRSALETYMHRLYQVPADQQPQIIIITGDLTLTGSRDELREAAADIRNLARRWDDLARRQHVFVLPGPHDIDWGTAANNASSLEAFAQEFFGFCLPILPGRDGHPLSSGDPFALPSNEHVLVYLVNTCYTPETPSQTSLKSLEDLSKRYRSLWKERAKTNTRPQGIYDDSANQQFLRSTEELLWQDTGLVRQDDVERFQRVMPTIRTDDPFALSYPANEQSGLLKILVTHHPLIPFMGRTGRMHVAALDAGNLVQAARQYGFHVALHGHTHEPHLLTDMPVELLVQGNEVPLVQIGAGALNGSPQAGPSFNELVAVRPRATNKWTLHYAPVNLLGPDPARRSSYYTFPLYSTSNTLQPASQPEPNTAGMREKFDQQLRAVLRTLAEDQDADVKAESPQRLMDIIKDTIKEVIFAGIETRVGLSLKEMEDGRIVLRNKYIDPVLQYDAQYIHPFAYPETVAAWALIQGEPIIYPLRDMADKPIDYDWLSVSGKLEAVRRAFAAAIQRRPGEQRVRELSANFDAGSLRMSHIFQPWPGGVPATRFGSFISMPIPLRTSAAFKPRQSEIGVLTVDVADAAGATPAQLGEAFTKERIDMLRTLSYVIDVILTTAHAARRPRGTWQIQGY